MDKATLQEAADLVVNTIADLGDLHPAEAMLAIFHLEEALSRGKSTSQFEILIDRDYQSLAKNTTGFALHEVILF